jgi:hypothetical protein
MLRLDGRADDDEQLALAGSDEDILPPSPAQEDAAVDTDAKRTHVDRAHIANRRRNIHAHGSGVDVGAARTSLAKINLRATWRQSEKAKR